MVSQTVVMVVVIAFHTFDIVSDIVVMTFEMTSLVAVIALEIQSLMPVHTDDANALTSSQFL